MRQAKTAATLVLILLGAVVSGSVLAAGGHGGSGGRGGSGSHGSHGGGGWHGGHSGGSRVSFGVFVGAPLFPYYAAPYYYPSYYNPPYYNYPLAVAGPAYSPAYVGQGTVQAAPAQTQANWWYYCADAESYYPYVRECSGGWVRVSPQPPSG